MDERQCGGYEVWQDACVSSFQRVWISGLCRFCCSNHAVLDDSDGVGDSWTFFHCSDLTYCLHVCYISGASIRRLGLFVMACTIIIDWMQDDR